MPWVMLFRERAATGDLCLFFGGDGAMTAVYCWRLLIDFILA